MDAGPPPLRSQACVYDSRVAVVWWALAGAGGPQRNQGRGVDFDPGRQGPTHLVPHNTSSRDPTPTAMWGLVVEGSAVLKPVWTGTTYRRTTSTRRTNHMWVSWPGARSTEESLGPSCHWLATARARSPMRLSGWLTQTCPPSSDQRALTRGGSRSGTGRRRPAAADGRVFQISMLPPSWLFIQVLSFFFHLPPLDSNYIHLRRLPGALLFTSCSCCS